MTYLLDTAVWVHLVAHPHLVPAWLLRRLKPEPVLGLASVSLLEVAILHRLGRLGWRGTLAQFFDLALAENVAVIELTAPVAVETNSLPAEFHGDPFDRVVAATARVLRLIPVTTDTLIRDHSGLQSVLFYPFKPGRRPEHPPA